MFILQLSLLSLFHIVLLSDGSDLFLDLIDHLLLLLLELVLLNLELLRIADDLLFLTVKLLIGFSLLTLSLQQSNCLQWTLT
jgi:hypothetical protein